MQGWGFDPASILNCGSFINGPICTKFMYACTSFTFEWNLPFQTQIRFDLINSQLVILMPMPECEKGFRTACLLRIVPTATITTGGRILHLMPFRSNEWGGTVARRAFQFEVDHLHPGIVSPVIYVHRANLSLAACDPNGSVAAGLYTGFVSI